MDKETFLNQAVEEAKKNGVPEANLPKVREYFAKDYDKQFNSAQLDFTRQQEGENIKMEAGTQYPLSNKEFSNTERNIVNFATEFMADRYPVINKSINAIGLLGAAGINGAGIAYSQYKLNKLKNNPKASPEDVNKAHIELDLKQRTYDELLNMAQTKTYAGDINKKGAGKATQEIAGDVAKTSANVAQDVLMSKGIPAGGSIATRATQVAGLTVAGEVASDMIKGKASEERFWESTKEGAVMGGLDAVMNSLAPIGKKMIDGFVKSNPAVKDFLVNTFQKEKANLEGFFKDFTTNENFTALADSFGATYRASKSRLEEAVSKVGILFRDSKIYDNGNPTTLIRQWYGNGRKYMDDVFFTKNQKYGVVLTNETKVGAENLVTKLEGIEKELMSSPGYSDNPAYNQLMQNLQVLKFNIKANKGTLGLKDLDLEQLKYTYGDSFISRYNQEIRRSIFETIESGLKNMPEELAKYREAQNFYNTTVGELDKGYIQELLNSKGQTQMEDYIDAILGSKENIHPETMQKFLGAEAYQQLKESVFNRIVESSTMVITRDGKNFLKTDSKVLRDAANTAYKKGLLDPTDLENALGIADLGDMKFEDFLTKGLGVPNFETGVDEVGGEIQGLIAQRNKAQSVEGFYEKMIQNPEKFIDAFSKVGTDQERQAVLKMMSDTDKKVVGLSTLKNAFEKSWVKGEKMYDPVKLMAEMEKIGGDNPQMFLEEVFNDPMLSNAIDDVFEYAKANKDLYAKDKNSVVKNFAEIGLGLIQAANGWYTAGAIHTAGGAAGLVNKARSKSTLNIEDIMNKMPKDASPKVLNAVWDFRNFMDTSKFRLEQVSPLMEAMLTD